MENEQQMMNKEKCDCGQCAECRGFFGTKTNGIFLLILIVLMVIAIVIMLGDKEKYFPVREDVVEEVVQNDLQVKDTYTYTNHGFSIELPEGYEVNEMKIGTRGDASISLPDGVTLSYITNAAGWEKSATSFTPLNDEKIGVTVFKVYEYNNRPIYWFRQGAVGYAFNNVTDKKILETFKFVGWPQQGCEGGYEKCVDSLAPTDVVSSKATTYEKIGITKSQLEALLKKEYAVCDPGECKYESIDISEATLKINGQLYEGVTLVTAITSTYDDSVAFQKAVAKLYKNESGDGVWRLSEPVTTWSCQPGRGHTDFSTKSCI
jgi:hypothetical protein